MVVSLLTVVLLPLLGSLINGAIAIYVAKKQKFVSEKLIAWIGTSLPALAFVIAVQLTLPFFMGRSDPQVQHVFDWIVSGPFRIDFSFMLDRLSAVMILIVTGIGTLIHLYSAGYMHKEPGLARYYSYLNLFLFSMLLLILGDNLLVLFVGWEGVGLCSYLLIGYWYEDADKAKAGKKAFVVNRIGDFGFLIGMFFIIQQLMGASELGVNILNFQFMQSHHELLAPMAAIITLCLFIGATGKSAQIPLYVWLPDAMAGPTPVSALIHAATMVTAGVYMMVRLGFLFNEAVAPSTMHLIATIGAITAFFAATIGLVQRDIKKVLAYSTVSQLGYMVLGVGVGAPAAAVFHLMTHAFFKACLFLGAGAVIYAMHHEQDIFKMGGLRKHLKTVYVTFAIAAIAIAGIPPFSGFFSKDEILFQTYIHGHRWLYLLGFLAAGCTAFYMFRLLALTFLGKPRFDDHHHKPHPVPFNMKLVLIILAILSFVGGWVGIPDVFAEQIGLQNYWHHWLSLGHESPSLLYSEEVLHRLEINLAIASALWGLGFAGLAVYIYTKKPEFPEKVAHKFKSIYQLLLDKYYVDEIYQTLIITPCHQISRSFVFRFVDRFVVDTFMVKGTAFVVRAFGIFMNTLQNGLVNQYALYFFMGALGVLAWLML